MFSHFRSIYNCVHDFSHFECSHALYVCMYENTIHNLSLIKKPSGSAKPCLNISYFDLYIKDDFLMFDTFKTSEIYTHDVRFI